MSVLTFRTHRSDLIDYFIGSHYLTTLMIFANLYALVSSGRSEVSKELTEQANYRIQNLDRTEALIEHKNLTQFC